MKPTRLAAIAVILGSFAVSAPNAQTLREAQPPAEFPPASFKGKQYVDSRGCIYVRAGVDGRVTWVPRVTRSRKQLCGYKPTAVAGTTSQPASTGPAPTVITLAPPAKPAPAPAKKARTAPATAVAAAPARKAAPKASAAARPKKAPAAARGTTRTVRAAPARPAPAGATAAAGTTTRVVVAAPSPRRTTTARPPAGMQPASTAPAKTGVKPAPVVAPRKAQTPTCPNASAFSQQFINRTGVRCGPQSEPPVTYVTGSARGAARGRATVDVASLPPDTVVIPRHIYDLRRNTTNVSVPRGYKPVWKDGRLNPRRAEHTLRPSVIRDRAVVPRGFRAVSRKDDRYNPKRGVRTAAGDVQTDMIWTRTVPRRLVPAPAPARVVQVPAGTLASPAEATAPYYIRVTSRAAAGTALPGTDRTGPPRQPGGRARR